MCLWHVKFNSDRSLPPIIVTRDINRGAGDVNNAVKGRSELRNRSVGALRRARSGLIYAVRGLAAPRRPDGLVCVRSGRVRRASGSGTTATATCRRSPVHASDYERCKILRSHLRLLCISRCGAVYGESLFHSINPPPLRGGPSPRPTEHAVA